MHETHNTSETHDTRQDAGKTHGDFGKTLAFFKSLEESCCSQSTGYKRGKTLGKVRHLTPTRILYAYWVYTYLARYLHHACAHMCTRILTIYVSYLSMSLTNSLFPLK